MKELTGTASGTVSAPADRCLELLGAIDDYPNWYPEVVRDVEVLERDHEGRPSCARATLHVAVGPLVRDVRMVLATTRHPPTVKLTRVPNDPSDEEQLAIGWRVDDGGAQTRILLVLTANLSVPRLLPLGGVGDSMARGFVEAACRALED